MRKSKIVAIIPARGGSKGIPRKNIKLLCDKPLIAYTIEAALGSKFIDKVVVSTEDEEISKISKKYGAEVIKRPKELARDDSPTIDAIMHAISRLERKGEHFDILILLEPTSPLRKQEDIDTAVKLFIRNISKADSLVSVGEVHLENPFIVKKIKAGYVKPFIKSDRTIYRRQQTPKVYFPYGVICLSKVETLKATKTFYQERTIPYFIERWQNYEIDDICDFICTEAVLKHQLSQTLASRVSQKEPLEIPGRQVYLKEFAEENLHDPRYTRWLRDTEVVETIGRPEYLKLIPFLEIENYVRRLWESKNDCFFAIYHKANQEFIGTLKIGSIDWHNGTADIGIMIGGKNYWGKGLAKDAISTACDYAFKFLGLRKLTGGCHETNTPMRKCFERVGFREEGYRRQQILFKGKYVGHIVYGMLKEEFYKNV